MKKKNPKREKLAKALTEEPRPEADYKPSLHLEKEFIEGDAEIDDNVKVIIEARVSGVQHDQFNNSMTFEIKKASIEKE